MSETAAVLDVSGVAIGQQVLLVACDQPLSKRVRYWLGRRGMVEAKAEYWGEMLWLIDFGAEHLWLAPAWLAPIAT